MTQVKTDGWVLIDKDRRIVQTDQEYENFRYERYRVAGGQPPHKPSSTGKIWVYVPGSELQATHEVYPTVFGMRWVEEGSAQIKSGLSLVVANAQEA